MQLSDALLLSIRCEIDVGWRYLGREVFENSRAVHRCGGSHSTVAGGSGLEVSVDTTHWELQR